jgi:signal transduction histidine kinase
MEFLTDRMKDYLSETLSRTKLTYTFEENIQNTHIAPDTRQNVYLIFKEAINNVLRHSTGDQVRVSLTRSGSRFLLIIRDNGQMTAPFNVSGLGLSNMKLRAETIGGEVTFDVRDGFEVRLVW